MAYTDDHVLIAWGGRMPGGEQWTNTLRMRPVTLGLPDQSVIEGWLTGGFKDALTTFWNNIQNNVGVGTYLDWVKANAIDTTGHYRDNETNRYDYSSPVQGIATAVPNQLSYVVSTLTDQRAGRAHIGRFFIPSAAVAVSGSTGLITTDVDTAYLEDAKDLLSGFNDTATIATLDRAKCAVMSGLGSGATHDIIGVGGGLVVDTQRRRRNKLLESRVEVNL